MMYDNVWIAWNETIKQHLPMSPRGLPWKQGWPPWWKQDPFSASVADPSATQPETYSKVTVIVVRGGDRFTITHPRLREVIQ